MAWAAWMGWPFDISGPHRHPLMLLAVVVASVSVGAGRATPPHIVHIMADDTGVRTTSGDRSGPGWLGLPGQAGANLRAAGLCGTCLLYTSPSPRDS